MQLRPVTASPDLHGERPGSLVPRTFRRPFGPPGARDARVPSSSDVVGSGLLALALLVRQAPFVPPGVRAAAPRVVDRRRPRRAASPTTTAPTPAAAAAGGPPRTDDVVTIFSPGRDLARVVKARSHGASLVVYLGHGNGWPSRYSKLPSTCGPRMGSGSIPSPAPVDTRPSVLRRAATCAQRSTLPPVPSSSFGHLCYACGSCRARPWPEPPLDIAIQRVDNFAAGCDHLGRRTGPRRGPPQPRLVACARCSSGRRSIARIWHPGAEVPRSRRRLPRARAPGAVPGAWTPGATTGGYTRSLVVAAGASRPGARRARAPDCFAVATGSDPPAAAGPFEFVLPASVPARRVRSRRAAGAAPRSRAAPSRARRSTSPSLSRCRRESRWGPRTVPRRPIDPLDVVGGAGRGCARRGVGSRSRWPRRSSRSSRRRSATPS